MKFTLVRSAVLVAGCLAAAAAFAQVDYSKKEQRNPTGDRDVERGYQRQQQEYRERQEKQRSETPRESTGTRKQEGETYGRDYMERQLGTEGKIRTY